MAEIAVIAPISHTVLHVIWMPLHCGGRGWCCLSPLWIGVRESGCDYGEGGDVRFPRQSQKEWYGFHLIVLGLSILECSQQPMRKLKQPHGEAPLGVSSGQPSWGPSDACLSLMSHLPSSQWKLQVSRNREETFPLCSVQNPDSEIVKDEVTVVWSCNVLGWFIMHQKTTRTSLSWKSNETVILFLGLDTI